MNKNKNLSIVIGVVSIFLTLVIANDVVVHIKTKHDMQDYKNYIILDNLTSRVIPPEKLYNQYKAIQREYKIKVEDKFIEEKVEEAKLIEKNFNKKYTKEEIKRIKAIEKRLARFPLSFKRIQDPINEFLLDPDPDAHKEKKRYIDNLLKEQ